MTTPAALHSKKSSDWGTPEEIVAVAYRVFGGRISFDLCSSAYWNRHVRAQHYFTEKNSPLVEGSFDWSIDPRGSVFCNPPGGLVKEFWRLCVQLHRQGHPALWVGFSVEQLAYLQKFGLWNHRYRRAILPRRLAFMQSPNDAADGLQAKAVSAYDKGNLVLASKLFDEEAALRRNPDGPPVPGTAPGHSNYLLLMPTQMSHIERFRIEMAALDAHVF